MSSGDRVGVQMPTGPITVVTRYGQLQLAPEVLSSIAFSSEDSGVHTITLTDGSKFSGLVTAAQFEMKLSNSGREQTVKFPVSAMNRLVIKTRPDDKDDGAPALLLKKDDLLVATLQGELKFDTGFALITMNGSEIKAMSHPKENAADVSVTTADGTVFSGQLQDQEIACHLSSGIDLRVPVALVQSYSNPQSQAPSMMVDRIKAIVADLNADDYKQRDAAEQQLMKIPGVAGTLKALRDKQTPEAQQRIDVVLKELDKQVSKTPPAPAPPADQ